MPSDCNEHSTASRSCVDLKEEANISGAFYHVAKQLHTIPTIGAINVARSAASDENRTAHF